MPINVTFTELSVDEARDLLAKAASGRPALPLGTPAAAPMPAAAPPPAAAAPPPPPPPQAAAGNSQDPLLAQVMTAMEAYAKTHKTAGAKKVLQQVGINKATEANQEQLAWLLQAFSNISYVPA